MSVEQFISDLEQEYLPQNELEQFRKQIREDVFKTFKSTRSINFREISIPYRTRCLHCSRSYNYFDDKRCTRYCSNDCRYIFYRQYHYPTVCSFVLKRDKGRCQTCLKLANYIVETVGWKNHEWKRSPSGKHQREIFIQEVSNREYDHIKEISTFITPEEKAEAYLDPANLQILCKPCHKAKTSAFMKKRNKNTNIHTKRNRNRSLVLSTFLDSSS